MRGLYGVLAMVLFQILSHVRQYSSQSRQADLGQGSPKFSLNMRSHFSNYEKISRFLDDFLVVYYLKLNVSRLHHLSMLRISNIETLVGHILRWDYS